MRAALTELYNTRYFYITYQRDLVYLFSTFLALRQDPNYEYNAGNEKLDKVYRAARVGAAVEFDLANAKISPDVFPTIQSYAEKGIIFIDSKDSWRNNILALNRERMKVDMSEFVTLPAYDGTILVKDYVKSLQKGTKYILPNNNPEVYIPLTYIAMVLRPSLIINLGGQCNAFFNFVGSRFTIKDLEEYKRFYFTSPEGTMILDFSQGDCYVQRIGYCDIEQALTVGSLVPTVLGEERLFEKGRWQIIFKNCLSMLNGYRATRKHTLGELFDVKE